MLSLLAISIIIDALIRAMASEKPDACLAYVAEIDPISAKVRVLPHFDQNEYIRCKNTTEFCLLGHRYILRSNVSMREGSVFRGNDLNEVKELYFWWCYEDDTLIDYLFNHTRPHCKDMASYNKSFGDFNVSFQCLKIYQYMEQPRSEGPESFDSVDDAESNEAFGHSMFDYAHAYATLPFLVFHVGLIVCLWRSGRRDPTYREGFFILFIALSVVDAVVVAHDNLFAYCPPLYAMTVDSGDPLGPPSTMPGPDVSIFLSCYCYMYQPLAHVVIAANRLNAFRSPNEYQWNWRDNSLKLIMTILFAVPLLLVGTVLPLHYGNFWAHPLETRKLVYLLLHVYRSLQLIGGGLTGFVLTAFAVVYIKRWSSREYSQVDSQEARLLGYSALMLVIQLWVGFWCGAEFLLSDDKNLGAYFSTRWRPFWYTSTLAFATRAYCLAGSVFLVFMSGHVRKTFLEFYRLKRPAVVPAVLSRQLVGRRHTLPARFSHS